MSATANRIQKWDILKFLLIFSVVLGHIAELYKGTTGLIFFIYSFHMPLFIFVSGLFSKKTINEKRYSKIFTYFILYIFIKIILCISNYFNKGIIGFRIFTENGVPWYAFAIFVFSLITILVKNLKPIVVIVFSILLAGFAGYDSSLGDFLVTSRIIVFYPFFYAGYALDANKIAQTLNKKSVKIISAAGIICYIILLTVFWDEISFLKPLLSGKHPFSVLSEHKNYGGFFRIGYYLFVFVFGAMIISLIPDKLGKGKIAELGSRSVQVYALHYVFIHLLYQNFHIDKWMESVFPVFPEIIILPLSIILTLICSSKIFTPVFDFVLKANITEKRSS